jgi:hypothetical protein
MLQEMPKVEDPPNSEVSKPFLRICAGAPAVVNDMQFALQKDEHGSYQKIPFNEVLSSFQLSQRVSCCRLLMMRLYLTFLFT